MTENLGRKLAISLGLGLLVFAAVSLYADLPKMVEALSRFEWRLLPLIFVLTLLNYGLRFVKWSYYLKRLGITALSRRESFLIFFAGLSMVVTPGKLGEWLKCYLLREVSGAPVSRSAPIVLAERLTDGLALTLLAVLGLAMFRIGWQVLLLVTVAGLGAIALGRWRTGLEALLVWGGRRPVIGPRIHHLQAFYESTYELLSLPNLAVAVGLGLVSWFGECLAFFFVLVGLGLAGSPLLLIQSSFILASSTIAGAAFLTPGGLGVAEGGIVGLGQFLLGMTRSDAGAAAILIRLGTLWFGVGLGAIALVVTTRRLARQRSAALGEVTTPPEGPAPPARLAEGAGRLDA